jgi:hypothetical protein
VRCSSVPSVAINAGCFVRIAREVSSRRDDWQGRRGNKVKELREIPQVNVRMSVSSGEQRESDASLHIHGEPLGARPMDREGPATAPRGWT